LIGEIYLPPTKLVAYYGKDLEGVHLPFNFSLLETRWHARTLAILIDEYEGALPPGSWPNWVLGNHDRPRIASRVGPEQTRVAAILLLTLRGTPTLYNGDELGMPMAHIPVDRVLDPFEVNVPGLGLGRDGARSPMPWSDGANAGFSPAEPWCPLIEDWKTTNVTVLEKDPVSILSLHRKLLALRNRYRALTVGSYHPLVATGDILLYRRRHEATSMVVALNLGPEPAALQVEDCAGTTQLSTYCDRADEPCAGTIDLRPHEGLVILESDAFNRSSDYSALP